MANYYSLTESSKYTQRRATYDAWTESRKFVQLIIELTNKIIENTRKNRTVLFAKNLHELCNNNR